VTSSTKHAACQAPDAPSPFPDEWGVGRQGRAKRAQALAICRTCPVRRECGLQALREFDSGLVVYGIRCGIAFTDITRQDRQIARLRTLVGQARLTASPVVGSPGRRRGDDKSGDDSPIPA
jgi:hypothetical protein